VLRALAERLSRDRVVRRRLPARLGGARLFVTPDAALRFWLPGLERVDPDLLRWTEELVEPGAIVWDVGANVGLFAFAAAHRAGTTGRVLAIETDDWLTSLMRRSAAGAPSPSAPVEILTAAVSGDLDTAVLAISRRGRAGSHLDTSTGSTQTGGTRRRWTVVTVTLDWLLDRFPAPDLVKIDVEGAEVACLQGAERLLSEVRPTLLCEVHAQNVEAVGQLLRAAGYRLHDARAAGPDRPPIDRPAWNTLAVAEEVDPAHRASQRKPGRGADRVDSSQGHSDEP